MNRSISVAGDVGFVFNCFKAGDYEGDFVNLTLPYRRLPRKLQAAIRRAALKSVGASLSPILSELSSYGVSTESLRRITQPIASKALDHSTITFFWSHTGKGFGFSIGVSYQVRKHPSADNPVLGIAIYRLMWTETGEGKKMQL